jgi:AraC-like DNA-binding protein
VVITKCALTVNPAGLELRLHGTPVFPCAGYDIHCTSRIEDEIVWHYHPEWECIVVREGKLRMQVPGKTFLLSAGEGIWINANIPHHAAAAPDCVFHSIVFASALLCGTESSIFSQKYLLPLARLAELDACPLTPASDFGKSALFCFAQAFEALRGEDFGWEFIVRDALSRLCLLLCRENENRLYEQTRSLPSDTVRLRKMLDHIHAHYAEPLTLSEIAKAGGVGARECLRCFQRVAQITPVQYLLKYRVMQSAALLLAEPEAGISEIALRCGFDSPSHYTQLFRRYFPCSPKAYRALHLKSA